MFFLTTLQVPTSTSTRYQKKDSQCKQMPDRKLLLVRVPICRIFSMRGKIITLGSSIIFSIFFYNDCYFFIYPLVMIDDWSENIGQLGESVDSLRCKIEITWYSPLLYLIEYYSTCTLLEIKQVYSGVLYGTWQESGIQLVL